MPEIILEKIINQLIGKHIIDFSNLNEKTIVLSLTDIHLNLCFFVNNNQVFVFDEIKENDAHISISFLVFKDLLNKKDLQDLIREDKVSIQGDIKVAQLLVDILKNNTLKENIEKILPDDFVIFAKKTKDKIFNGEIKDKIIDTLIAPKVYK